jgi:hypothetical protein
MLALLIAVRGERQCTLQGIDFEFDFFLRKWRMLANQAVFSFKVGKSAN